MFAGVAHALAPLDGRIQEPVERLLLALEREKNPDGARPDVTLRGFSWIVSPYESGVLVHLEMEMGTASAGPLHIDQARLTTMMTRSWRCRRPPPPSPP